MRRITHSFICRRCRESKILGWLFERGYVCDVCLGDHDHYCRKEGR